LRRANLGLERLRIFARLAHDLHYLDPRRYEYAARAIDEVGRSVGAWIKTAPPPESVVADGAPPAPRPAGA
jgi:hypothetical protein